MCPNCNKRKKMAGYKYCYFCLDDVRFKIRQEQAKHDIIVHTASGQKVVVLGE